LILRLTARFEEVDIGGGGARGLLAVMVDVGSVEMVILHHRRMIVGGGVSS